jgi:hypothetical protein
MRDQRAKSPRYRTSLGDSPETMEFIQKQMATGNRHGSVSLVQLQRMRVAAARAKLTTEQ